MYLQIPSLRELVSYRTFTPHPVGLLWWGVWHLSRWSSPRVSSHRWHLCHCLTCEYCSVPLPKCILQRPPCSQITLDTGVTTSMVHSSFIKHLHLSVTPAARIAQQANSLTLLEVFGELHVDITQDKHNLSIRYPCHGPTWCFSRQQFPWYVWHSTMCG